MSERAIGIIGIGSIGGVVARRLAAGDVPGARLHAIAGLPAEATALGELSRLLGCRMTTDPAQLPALGADLVVEAAGVAAARTYVIGLLEAGVDVLMMSVGSLADGDLRARVVEAARRSGRRVHIPSGGIAGLDGVRSAAVGEIELVRVTTRKAPVSLRGAPHLDRTGVDVDALTEPTVIFDGTSAEAIVGFPANVNVTVAVGLAAGDPARVRSRVIAEPGLPDLVQELSVVGEFGQLDVRISNRPSPANPRTSTMAAFSAIAALRKIVSPIQIA